MDPDFEVWPENWTAVRVFSMLSTQWRHGFAGPTGLDYNAIDVVVEKSGLSEDVRDDDHFFDSIRVLEGAALEKMAEDRERAQKK